MVKICGKIVSTWHVLVAASCCYWACFLAMLSLHSSSSNNMWHSPGAFSASRVVFNMFSWSSNVELPALSLDGSELVLSSVLERSARSRDLFITSFLIAKSTLDPRERGETNSVIGVAASAMEKVRTLVQKQSKLTYNSNGERSRDVRYFCKVKLNHRSAVASELIPAHFLPNRLTSDFHSNRKLDFLRCPLKMLLNSNSSSSEFSWTALQKELMTHTHDNDDNDDVDGKNLQVQLYREETLLTSFLIPWRTRCTGYLLSAPASASRLHAWKGLGLEGGEEQTPLDSHDANYDDARARVSDKLDSIHLCVTNSQEKSLYHLLEFLEHHKQIGVQHVHYSVAFSWKSASMQQLLRSLQDYIRQGFLTIQSSADQKQDSNIPRSATEGIHWHPSTERIMQINSCLYLAKGNAEYVGVWDLDDFFVPSTPLVSLVEVLQRRGASRASSVEDKTDPVSPANAELIHEQKNVPPNCFIAIETRSVYPNAAATLDESNLWLSSQYDENTLLRSMSRGVALKRYIMPTDLIFQGGLHMPGGCRLPAEWSGCDAHSDLLLRQQQQHALREGFCYNNLSSILYSDQRTARTKDQQPQAAHLSFDDVVLPEDGCSLRPADEGVLYSFRSASTSTTTNIENSESPGEAEHKPSRDIFLTSENQYGQHFSPRVESVLNAKGYSRETLLFPIFKSVSLVLGSMFKTWGRFASTELVSLLQEPSSPNASTAAFSAYNVPSQEEKVLPSFVSDCSDLCLGSLIERQHNSFQLHVSTFFLQHELLYAPPKGYGVIKIRNNEETKRQWRNAIMAFNDTHYSHTGERLGNPRYFCRISVKLDTALALNVSSEAKTLLLRPYSVRGVFMPNSLTVDQNANRRVDILRCPMRNSELLHTTDLPHSREVLSVDIYREKVFLNSFDIPWSTRRVGFSLSSPRSATKFDAWQNYPVSEPSSLSGKTGGAGDHATTTTVTSTTTATTNMSTSDSDSSSSSSIVLHMCVPGFESPISQRSLTVYAEFLQHHFSLGVQHMFVAAAYSWGGVNMVNFLAAFRSFIDEGVLTVTSLAEEGEREGEEHLYSILGATFDRDNVKIFQVTSCLYLSKGVADYVAVWDNDEFFVPRPPHHSILDVIRAAEAPHPLHSSSASSASQPQHSHDHGGGHGGRSGSAGWADGDGHPFCFLHLKSEVIYAKNPSDFDYFSPNRDVKRVGDESASSDVSDFIGDHFSHLPEAKRMGLAFQKSILPTRLIFQAGLHVGAACRLPVQWTHCHNRSGSASPSYSIDVAAEAETPFCYSSNSVQYHGYTYENRKLIKNSPLHDFDSLVQNKDARLVSKEEAVLYHVQVHRYHLAASAESTGMYKMNDYSKYYFPAVIQELKRRHIFELLTTKNFQTFFESGSYWGSYLTAPDPLSTPEYIASHHLLQTLPPAQGAGSSEPAIARRDDAEWLDFQVFYAKVVSSFFAK